MLQKVAFHQKLQCLLRQNCSSEKEIQYHSEIIACDPSIYIKEHPDLTISNYKGNSIGLQRVKGYFKCLCSYPVGLHVYILVYFINSFACAINEISPCSLPSKASISLASRR